ncbi:MAG: hypothetical protein ACK4VZ_15265 [Paracoccaceae bacterium]
MTQMGGASAGVVGLLFVLLSFASPPTCLIAALIMWILVLPKWTVAALMLFLVSCCLQFIMWTVEPETLVLQIAFSGSFALSVGALLMIPAALAFRFGAVIFAVTRRNQERRPHPET